MAASSTSDDASVPVTAHTATDPTVDQVMRDAGFTITEAGKQRWRRRLATPIPAEALEEGQRMLERAQCHAA